RMIYNESQTKMSGEQRWENSAGIVSLDVPDKIAGKNVIVIDDIITPGATMASCCAELSKASGVQLYVASVAFTC
ncbi:MAG: ComF family protein, partial [Paludibacteraceae bacterium]|nr:ComF family protein [Paludibacteraceae bacterium]